MKRLFDVTVSLLGLFFLMPFLTLIALRIKRDTPGPVFYRGPRVGRNGKIFYILKFRTMHERPESYQGPRVTAQDDPRITALGRWLRETKLNELPQLVNVLIGDMSFVGPRPEDPDIVVGWPEAVQTEVLSVRPGITSPASVIYRNEEELLRSGQVMSTYLNNILPSKLRLDQLYVRNRSFLLDLDILFWTFMVLIPTLGNYSPPEESLFLGPFSRFIRRYVSWFVIDTLVTFLAMGLMGWLWRSLTPLNIGWPKALWITIGFSLLFSLSGAFLGVNRISWSRASFNDAFDLLPSAALATVLALVINHYIQGLPLLPPVLVLMASGLAFLGFVLVRYRSRVFSGLAERWLQIRGRARAAQERVLVVGGGEAGQFAVWMLTNSSSMPFYQAVGFVDDDLYKQGLRIRGVEVLGSSEEIPRLVQEFDIGIIVFAIHNISVEDRHRLLKICLTTPARVALMPDFVGAIDAARRNGRSVDDLLLIPVRQHLSEVDHLLEDIYAVAKSGDRESLLDLIETYRMRLHSGSRLSHDPIVSRQEPEIMFAADETFSEIS